MKRNNALSVIIVGGGEGKRFGKKKQFETIYDKPIIIWSSIPFLSIDEVFEIIYVVPEEDLELMRGFLQGEPDLRKISTVIEGGQKRQDSTGAGFNTSSGQYIAIHDAVRPLIDVETIRKCFEMCKSSGASIVAETSSETVKEVGDDNNVVSTLNRDSIYLVKTPQIFKREILGKALKKANDENFYGTDTSSLVERYSLCDVYVIEQTGLNIKMTVKDDLLIVEKVLETRLNSQ